MFKFDFRLLALPAAALLLASLAVSAPAANAAAKHKASAKAGKMVTLPDGLKYQDLVVGKGPMPKVGQTVTVTYVGTLTNGTVFDASARHGDGTFSFPLGIGQVIPGWDEGVKTMHVGGKRKLIVPPGLAYGQRPLPGIPANSTLIFTIQLLKVQ